jgi:hypothetical protein
MSEGCLTGAEHRWHGPTPGADQAFGIRVQQPGAGGRCSLAAVAGILKQDAGLAMRFPVVHRPLARR